MEFDLASVYACVCVCVCVCGAYGDGDHVIFARTDTGGEGLHMLNSKLGIQ